VRLCREVINDDSCVARVLVRVSRGSVKYRTKTVGCGNGYVTF